MNQDKYIFSQIVDLLPRWTFDACVKKYSGNKRIKNLTCHDQFLALMFGQFTNLNSLRGIVLCLNVHPNQLYIDENDFSIDLKNTIYALDSTIIDLCLATFKWAYFELKKSAVKIHTQLDLKGNIPSFFLITKAKTHDVNFLDHIKFE